MRMKLMQLILIGMVMTVLTVTACAQGALPQAGQGVEGQAMLPVVGDPSAGGGFTLGSDGTIYIMTRVAATSTTSASTMLTAYSGTNGSVKFNLTIPVGTLGQPVPAPDGRLFLVAEGRPAYTTKSTTVAAVNAQFIIVTPATKTYNTVPLSGEMASAPVFFGASASYKYYFTVTNISTSPSGKPVITTVLNVYTGSNDTELFSISPN